MIEPKFSATRTLALDFFIVKSCRIREVQLLCIININIIFINYNNINYLTRECNISV